MQSSAVPDPLENQLQPLSARLPTKQKPMLAKCLRKKTNVGVGLDLGLKVSKLKANVGVGLVGLPIGP